MVINPIVGVYKPIIRIPIKGGMTIPNIATFDHGTDRGRTCLKKKKWLLNLKPIKGILSTPPQTYPPPRNKALLRETNG